jgi:hypothetical protein
VGACLLCTTAAAQLVPAGAQQPYWPTPLVAGLRPVVALGGNWQLAGSNEPMQVQVPFTWLGPGPLTLEREFFLKSTPTHTLYIHLAGAAPAAQVFVNGRLLALLDEPYTQHCVQVPVGVLHSQWNLLRVQLVHPPSHALGEAQRLWLPSQPVFGLYGPVHLLAPDTLAPHFADRDTLLAQQWPLHDSLLALAASAPPLAPAPDSVLVYANLEASHGLASPPELLGADFAQARLLGARYVYFPFAVTPQLLHQARLAGLQPVQAPGRWVALYREYGPAAFPNAPRWQQADGTQTRAIRQYLDTHDTAPYLPGLAFHILAIGICLLMLVVAKLAAPQAFDAIVLRFEGLQPWLAPTRDPARFSGQAGLVLWLAGVFFQSLAVFYWLRLTWELYFTTGEYRYLHTALLGTFSQPHLYPYAAYLKVLALVLGLQAWRYAVAGLGQMLYPVKGLTDAVARTEVVGGFPFWGLVLLCAATPLLSPQAAAQPLAAFCTGLAAVAFGYHFATFWLQIRTLRDVHPIAKTLYLCAVEILPMAFLL